MNELIKTFQQDNGQIAVDGRDLHDFLEVKERYNDWIQRMVEYGFTENIDFVSFTEKRVKPNGGRPKLNHALSLDMAKELAMIQRTEKGKQARQYFISMEKQVINGFKIPQGYSEALWLAADYAEQVEDLKSENKQLQIPALLGNAVAGATESIPVGTFAKFLAQNGVEIGQNRLFKWLREHGYLIDAGRRHNAPTQRSIGLGVLEVRESVISTNHGSKPRFTPLVTGKGQQYFTNKFLKAKVTE